MRKPPLVKLPIPAPADEETESERRVKHVLEQEVARVESPETADAVVDRLEQMAGDTTEQQAAEQTAESPVSAASAVEHAAHAPTRRDEVADVLIETSAQAIAPTSEAPEVLEAAQRTMLAPPETVPPRTRRGRELLKQAVFRRMGLLQALDARLFLAVNNLPHPRWLNGVANIVTVLTVGGWIWGICLYLAHRWWGVPRTRRALRTLMPSLIGATWIVEQPVKRYFRRRRPFITIVRALVVGKQPGSWSFPSGHTASSFAAALMVSRYWPKLSPVFFGLASLIGFSRVYVGAHYPGDVTAGASLGLVIAEVIRRVVRALSR